ncbi:uncharacterized protein LOC144572884 [Carex rostrata]
MDVARALSFDVPSSSIIPFEESLVCVGDVDEDIEIKELLVDPYPEIEQIEEPFDQCFESFVEPYLENEQIEELLDQCFEPFVGMELDSIDATYKFYNYGFKTGFSIRKTQKYHSQIGEKKNN